MKRTMGSCGIGRAEISVAVSGPMAATSSVHETLFCDIHVMYCQDHTT